MFHVHKDARTQRSANTMADALCRLLSTTPLDRITVTALCKQARVARTTFYRSFDHVEDIATWRCSSKFLDTAARLPRIRSDGDRDRIIRASLSRWHGEEPLLGPLARDGRLDLMERAFLRHATLLAERIYPDKQLVGSEKSAFARAGASFAKSMASLRFDDSSPFPSGRWVDAFVRGVSKGSLPNLAASLSAAIA